MDRPRRSQRAVPTSNNTPFDSPRASSPMDSGLPDGFGAGSSSAAGGLLHGHATDLVGTDIGSTHTASRKHKYKPYQTHNDPRLIPPPSSMHPQTWPMARDSAPQRPQTAVGPGQALHTTFPSRMKFGVSTLMQPLPPSGDQSDPMFGRSVGIPSELLHPGPSGSRRSGRATANQRRYFEEESEDDDDEEDDNDNNDDQANGVGQMNGISSPRRNHASVGASGGTNTPNNLHGGMVEEPPEKPGQRLGRPPPGNKILVKRAKKTPHLYYSEADAARAADHREMLIPIRIELETETHRIRDLFTWNANEKLLTPAHFARIFLQDLDLPIDPYANQIEAAINQQIEEWSTLAEIDVGPARGGIWSCRDPDASKGEKFRSDITDEREKAKDARAWNWGIEKNFKREMKRLKRESGPHPKKRKLDNASATEIPEGSKGEWEDDLRIVLDYQVQILQHTLRDRLEWDLSSPLTPEAFASKTCKDLGLSGEALPAISTAIRESLLNHKRGAMEQGMIGLGEMWGKAQEDEDDARRQLAERRKQALEQPAQSVEAGGHISTPTPIATPNAHIPKELLDLSTTTSSRQSPMTTRSHTAAVVAATTSQDQRPASPVPMDPQLKLEMSISTKTELNNRGPRVLLATWRDWFEAKEFGPLLEKLSLDEIERREIEAMRSSRRNRRAFGGVSTVSYREAPQNARFRAR
ncbi:unnamed protein product [Sympodiomycopsis kandeliae]